MTNDIIDARGLSCPQPVLLALNRIKTGATGGFAVLLDNNVSMENVTRLATSQGWSVKNIEQQGETYRLQIEKD
jgi:tRNA 2-thiouridine synthesizing protein A